MSNLAVADRAPVEMAQQQTQQDTNPFSIVQWAMQNGATVDQLTKVYEFQRTVAADMAKMAYTKAMADFKMEPLVVRKDKENKQYSSWYTSIENMVNTVNPVLSKHGLSARWDIQQQQDKTIKVVCIMTHLRGHSESVSMTVPPDTSGAKNPLQQIKSSITYAKICTYESACGIASAAGNLSDDGNGSGNKPGLPDEEFIKWREAMEAAANLADLQSVFKKAYEAAKAIKDSAAQAEFIKIKDARKAQIAGAA